MGWFYSVDPLAGKYPELTPYQFASNRPIDGIDRDGLEWFYMPAIRDKNGNIDEKANRVLLQTEAEAGKGIFESGKGTIVGLYNIARHPINTIKSLWRAGTHPIVTAKAIKNQTVKEFKENPAESLGKLTGGFAQLLFGGELVKGLSGAEEVSSAAEIEDVAKTGTKLLGRNVDAFWGKVFNYRNGGQMSAIEHIMYRHSYNSGFTDVSKFLEGASAKMIKEYVDQTIKYGKPIQGGFEYNFGRVIGTGSNGAAATSLRVYIRNSWVRSAFPF